MVRSALSGFVFALVSGFTACSGGSVPGSRISSASEGLSASTKPPARVLLYSFSMLNIPSVPAQLDVLEQTLERWRFEVDRSVDPAVFTDQSLANYAAVAM